MGVCAMDIAKKFQNIRNEKKLSVYKLSNLADVSQNYIHNIEKGINQPSIYILEKLLKPMGITLSEFFNDNSDIYYLSEFEKEVLYYIRTLTEPQANIILDLIKNMNLIK